MLQSTRAPRSPSSDRRPSPEKFKAVFSAHPAGVAVITADAGEGPVALTATSVFSVSTDPPLLGFSLSMQSSSTPTIRNAESVVVHLLGADELALAKLGATSGIDRFEDESIWTRLAGGEPLFTEAPRWIRGSIIDSMEAGLSYVVLVRAEEIVDDDSGMSRAPLVYHDHSWHRLSESSRLH
ncbi:flavin reductase family protein [Rhodococcus sp. 5G237]